VESRQGIISPAFFINYNRIGQIMSIQIIAKKKNKTVVLDEATNKKDAEEQVNYWKNLKGKSWRITSKSK